VRDEMKKYILCLVLVLLSLIGSSCIAQEISFAGIKWNDTPDTVTKKLLDNGLTKTQYMSVSESEYTLFDAFKMMYRPDKERWDKYREIKWYPETNDEREQVGKTPFLKKLHALNSQDDMFEEVDFYFTFEDDTLVSYIVKLSDYCTEEEYEGRLEKNLDGIKFSNTFEALIEKYGPPTYSIQDKVYWSTNNQTLYYWCSGGHNIYLIYLNEDNIEKHISQYTKKVSEIRNSINKENKSKTKKLF
jgi:hypothetical protein